MHAAPPSPPAPSGYRLVPEQVLASTVAFRTTMEGRKQLNALAATMPDRTLGAALRWLLDVPIVQDLISARLDAFGPEEPA